MKLRNLVWVFIILFGLITISVPTASSSALNAEPLPTNNTEGETTDKVKQAILEAIAANDLYVQAKMVPSLQVSDIKLSTDQLWATAWIVYYDLNVGAIIPTEPGIAVTHFEQDQWKVYLPSDSGWISAIDSSPEDLISKTSKDSFAAMNEVTIEAYPTQSGYFLPWHGGEIAYLSRSVGHDASFTTAHYAFDFYKPGTTICPGSGVQSAGISGLNFNLNASKAGTVWGWEDSVANCDHSSVNFLVIRNVDDPNIYQLYMHLAQGSIPSALKSVGAPVARGQFIGVADNTGISTGSHLHFQIENQPNWPAADPYWNKALDVTFDDVDINGGRPRVFELDNPYCKPEDICSVFRPTYLSNNYFMGDSTPPTGGLSGVENGQVIQTEIIGLSGWGTDSQSGFDYGLLRAYFNGSWHDLVPRFKPNFTYNWNLCSPDLVVNDGVVSIALMLYDVAGNPAPLVGFRHFIKDFSCPSPPLACIPNDNQVALFEDPYYKGGCVLFNEGNYPSASSLGRLGDNDADSIIVGKNVMAAFYSNENFSGHSQGIDTNTGYFGYQWVEANTLSSMKVSSRAALPNTPVQINPLVGTAFRQGDVIPFGWLNNGGSIDYQVEIYLNSNLLRVVDWQKDPAVFVGDLLQGAYSWRVRGRNAAGMSNWSQFSAFSIESGIIIPPVETLPYSDTMETTQADWARDGLWRYVNNPAMARSGMYSWWYQSTLGNYDNSQPNSGSLTSSPFTISSPGYFLRFYYRTETETQGKNWDQRWVQISVDNGPFTNLSELSDDPRIPETASWLRIKAIDLTGYTGHTIRIRFNFSTLDSAANSFTGWGIDDFSITAVPPQNCSESRSDDLPEQAFLLQYDPTITLSGAICPNGDYDYYKFNGQAGDRIVADVDAMKNNSLLDSYLFLIDSDGKSILAENDDEIYAQRRDPLLTYTLPHTGTYYLKLRAWKHPLVGGDGYFYTIRLFEDRSDPAVNITWPLSGTFLPDGIMTITADISDVANGVNSVEFYWHSTDWYPGGWVLLGTDRDGTDGWKMTFNPVGQPEGRNGAIQIRAYDMAGNYTDAGAWNLGIDKTAPVTTMKPLNSTQPSNAFPLEWTSSDNLSGIDFVEIQEKKNNADWTLLPSVDGSILKLWIIGDPGTAYAYRMHGVDNSANSENYPTNAEASTAIPADEVICYALDSFDTSGNDNTPANASLIYANGASQFHNFCNPLSSDYRNDEDWARLDVSFGENYLIHSVVNSMPTATSINLFAQDGTTLIAESSPRAFGDSTYLAWKSDRTGSVYLRFRHLDGRVIGTNVGSTITVKIGSLFFFPILNR